jgi:hypothetical protein
MTELRDARLRQALDAAPDAQLRPLPRTREAVLAAARAAAVPAPWWRGLGGRSGAGASRAPWNAAFATLLVAGIVTLLWQGQEVPPARTERADPNAGAPRAVAPAAQPAAPIASAAALARQPAPPAAPVAAQAPAPVPVPAPAPVPAPVPAPAPVRERRQAPQDLGEAARQAAPAELAKKAESEEVQARAAPLQDSAAVAPAAPPAPAPAAAMAPQQGRARATLAARPAWNRLEVEAGGRSSSATRDGAPALAALLDSSLRQPVDAAAFSESADFRVQVLRDDRLAGTLLVGQSQLGWQPAGTDDPPWQMAPGPDSVRTLRAELERLLPK